MAELLTEKIIDGVYQILCFAIEKIEQKPMFLMHNTYFLRSTLYKDVFVAVNKNPELPSYVVINVEGDIFQAIYNFNF